MTKEEKFIRKNIKKPSNQYTCQWVTCTQIARARPELNLDAQKIGKALCKLNFTKRRKRINGTTSNAYRIINDYPLY